MVFPRGGGSVLGGIGSEVWQRVDRREGKIMMEESGGVMSSGSRASASRSVASDGSAPISDGKDGDLGSISRDDEVLRDDLHGDSATGLTKNRSERVDRASVGLDEGWTTVINKKNKMKLDAAVKGKSVRFKDTNRSFAPPASFKGGEGKLNRVAGALPVNARKVFDRRAQRPKSSVVINLGAEKRSWLDVCASRRKISSLLEMGFVTPVCEEDGLKIADVPNCLVKEAAVRWENTLVGYVLGDVPFFGQIFAWAKRSWRTNKDFRVFSKENGFFYFQFESEEDRDAVLRNGPWLFDGRLVVLQRWGANLGFDRDILSSAPVWVRLPHLPLHLWSAKILSIITSVIGVPICLDRATASMERISFARCLVEVNAAYPLARFVTVRHEDGSRIRVEVQYEGEPPRCGACLCFGHTEVQCSRGGSAGVQIKVAAAGQQGISDLHVAQLEVASSQGIDIGEICNGINNVRPCVGTRPLAAPSLVTVARDELCNELSKRVEANPMESVLGRLCKDDIGGDQSDVGGSEFTTADRGLEVEKHGVSSVVNGFVPIDEGGRGGDNCKGMSDVGISVNACNASSEVSAHCDARLAVARCDAREQCIDKLAATRDEDLACIENRSKEELGRKQMMGGGAGMPLTPVVPEGGGCCPSALLTIANDSLGGLLDGDMRLVGMSTGLMNGCVGELVGTDSLFASVVLSSASSVTLSEQNFAESGSVFLSAGEVGVSCSASCASGQKDQFAMSSCLPISNENLVNGLMNGPKGLVVNGPENYLVNGPVDGQTEFMCSPPCKQNSPLFLNPSLFMNVVNSPPRGSLPCTQNSPLFVSPPRDSPPCTHNSPVVCSPPFMNAVNSLPRDLRLSLNSDLVKGVDGSDLTAVGFQFGKQVLTSDVVSNGPLGDGSDSFKFTKINETWNLEQEEAKRCSVLTKKSCSSKVVDKSSGTRKSSRFVGGSGPTPPARFR